MIDTGKQMHALATRQHSAKLSSDNHYSSASTSWTSCKLFIDTVPGTLPVRVSALTDHHDLSIVSLDLESIDRHHGSNRVHRCVRDSRYVLPAIHTSLLLLVPKTIIYWWTKNHWVRTIDRSQCRFLEAGGGRQARQTVCSPFIAFDNKFVL
jgi:hypothetical protein